MPKTYNWFYTFYLAATDEVYASGTAKEVMEKMGIDKDNFHSMISRIRKGGNKKWVVIVEDIDTGEFVTHGQANVEYHKKRQEEKRKRDDKLWELYNKGYNDCMIARESGYSTSTIEDWRHRNDLPPRYIHEKTIRRLNTTK